ncbi:putative disease resistance RPP8-like protein 2 [Carex rostrata]
MAEGIVTFVLENLSDDVVKEVLQIQGVGKQVETLSRELSRIKSFLKDADMMQTLNERQKNWVNEVRDVAYDIEDVIDNAHFLKVPENPSKELPRGSSRIVGAAKRMWGKRKRLPALHNLGSEMNEILARIQDIIQSRENYEITFSGEGSGERPKIPVRPIIVPDIDDPYVVGFDPHRDDIVKQLLSTSTKRRAIISIVGPGGLGKTTLARKVYNSNDVKRLFDVHIWVAISQEFNLMDILRKIIEQVKPLLPNDLEGGEQHLPTKLYQKLNGKKYLLVLDDIWTSDLWTQIGGVLPDEIGSGVIITTRIQNIIGDAEPYKLPYLTEKASLELLLKKALPNRDLSREYPEDLYELGEQFVKKCGGLPLALVVLGGFLLKRLANYAAWSKMLHTMNWGTDGRECTEIIATSYNDLPFVLKSCFMYLAVFPEDHEIDVEILFQLWVAERLIPVEESRTLEDTAEIFLEDLVQRSLVQVSRRSHVGSITSCRIHDLLREVAIQKAKEDNFVTICSKPPDNWMSVAKARRVAVHYSGCDELMKHANPNLRSLLCFDKPLPNCSQQRLLKVLSDMHGYRSDNPINFECFHGLTHLRYCKLVGTSFSHTTFFQSFINGLKFVETLDFGRLTEVGELPECIWNAKTLRHVELPRHTSGPSSSADLKTLQTLSGVKSRESWNAQLPKLPNLRSLDIEVKSSFSWDLFAKLLETLKHLTSLQLRGNQVPLEIVNMQRFPFYQHLQSLFLLDMSPSVKNKLSLQVGMFPIHITELILNSLQFNVDPLPVLEKLCNLRRLWLAGQENQKMSCSAGGFKQLHELEFIRLGNLEELEIKSGAMPLLKGVTLTSCDKLEMPLGLQYLSNLKELKVIDCRKLKEHADEIRDICKHVPSKLII